MSATPTTLEFTQEDWFRSQTVTVRAGASSAGETAELAHEASGTTTDSQGLAQSNYDFEDDRLPTVMVQVRESDTNRSDSSAALSVADAEATEGVDETLDFVVRLDPKPSRKVTVDYRTEDGTATAGSDYTETSGTLTFAPGEDEQTVSVPITDDAVEDDGETFTLVLSNASGADFANNDNEAVGTIRNTETTARPDLTASFEGLPEAHDGETAFTFRVAFSEDIGISFQSLREDAFTVSGGRVTGGKRVDDRRDLFEMTVEPDGGGDVTITLPAGRECEVSGAICTKGENRRQLTNTPAATVADELQLALFSSNHWFEESRQVKAAEDFPVRGGGSSADVDATQSGAASVRRIRTLSSSGSSCDWVIADHGLQFMDSLPEERRWGAFPRFPLIDDGLTGGAHQARESSLADVEVSAQRFELNVIVLGNGGPGQWHWRGGRAALSAVVVPTKVQRVLQCRPRAQAAEGRPRIIGHHESA